MTLSQDLSPEICAFVPNSDTAARPIAVCSGKNSLLSCCQSRCAPELFSVQQLTPASTWQKHQAEQLHLLLSSQKLHRGSRKLHLPQVIDTRAVFADAWLS